MIDYCVTCSGPLADRPDVSATRMLFFVTDAGDQRWTYCDGTQWLDVAPGLDTGTSYIPPATFARANHTGTQAESTITNLVSDLAAKLDGSSNIAFSQLPTGTGASQVAVGNHTHGGGGFEFPIGYIVETILPDNPSVTLGYGTWVEFGAGRVLVGFDSGDSDFDTVEETGGAKTHTLTTGEIPSHTHTQDAHGHTVNDAGHTHLTQRYPTATGGSSGFTIDTSMSGTLADNTLPTKSATTGVTVNNQTAVNQNTGGGAAHNNMPPYIVAHRWLRTA